jgi:hypothetical protein
MDWPEHDAEVRAFIERNRLEMEAAYQACEERIARSLFAYSGEPYEPPKRWTREWWQHRWWAVRSATVHARRRVGMWIGGINPSELEGD